MTLLEQVSPSAQNRGLDVLETLADQRGWVLETASNGDLIMESVGDWCTYAVQFAWSAEFQSLHITCSLDMRLPNNEASTVNDLLALINAKLWIGHFAVVPGIHAPAFRHTILMNGSTASKAAELEDIIQTGLGECERFYPAFQFAAFNNMPAHDAMACALFECAGNA
ncbi:YbjN domain-containing protein [Terasakiella sp. A23]|uniref:YbjN domain-containing protein n=1 Tax=Terasakiella sp. FCG-A23 TaxID=3080561 RepID=UPI002954C72F|nr:YbjN domain-containing protein [Terasakiella sp. A23]MDV7338048.1 YbjN domain-containing protein [Terasakiella sp. A23]